MVLAFDFTDEILKCDLACEQAPKWSGAKKRIGDDSAIFLFAHSTREHVHRLSVTIQMKGTEHYVSVVLFNTLY